MEARRNAATGSVGPVRFRWRIERRRLAVLAVRHGLVVALFLWIVVLSLASQNFLSWLNFLNVARQAAPIVIISVGMTLVIATAGIDLSVGSLVALTSCFAASWLAHGGSVAAVIPGVLAIGTIAGVVNGYFVTLGLPAFVVTLAALVYLRGLAFVYSNGYAVPVADPVFLEMGRGELLGIHVPIWIAAVVAFAGWFALNKTRLGLYTLAIGGREEAARLMGLKIDRIKIVTYATTGFLAALGSIVITARLSNGSPNAGIMLELDAIAATVLGGTSLFGGVANIGGTVAGVLFINFVRNGLNLLGVNPFWVQVVTGFILLVAVLLNTVVNRRIEEWARLGGSDREEAR
jgi:ribose/xylose/arabinose/galactoside ABC-type transport system permease subunit